MDRMSGKPVAALYLPSHHSMVYISINFNLLILIKSTLLQGGIASLWMCQYFPFDQFSQSKMSNPKHVPRLVKTYFPVCTIDSKWAAISSGTGLIKAQLFKMAWSRTMKNVSIPVKFAINYIWKLFVAKDRGKFCKKWNDCGWMTMQSN